MVKSKSREQFQN